MMQSLPLMLAGLLILVVLWSSREQKQAEARTRLRQLRLSASLFDAHAEYTAHFLEDPAASPLLQRTLIQVSDAMTEQRFVLKMTELLVSNPHREVSPDNADIVDAIHALRQTNPETCSLFANAILTGTFAAVLRWPDSAVLFLDISARIAADPKRDVDLVLAASGHRHSTLPFGIDTPSAAMA